eukprot:3255175-Alexandrium_andersonii.AAC.1
MAEAVGVADAVMNEEPRPMAEGVFAVQVETAAPGAGPPPMAEAFTDAPSANKLPFAEFPGLSDTEDPVMQACHAAWNELVELVGPDFINQ